MSHYDPEPERALERLIFLFVALLAVLAFGRPARADVISEIGAGYKLPTTSVVMRDYCHEVQIIETRPTRPDFDYRHASCGGDNPAFIGWPVAWERDFGVWTLRAGWFHLSHWFDGRQRRELHMDAAAVSATINWSELRRRRK